MAFDVYLFTFSKRTNSTKRPNTEDGVKYSGLLREPCGIVNPTIGFEFDSGFNPSEYNFAYIPTFGRYYRITEWTANGRLWVGSMNVDALASWKEYIEASTQYVLRSSNVFDPKIIDMMYPTVTQPTVVYEYYDIDGITYSFSSGSYILGILSPDLNGVGASVYYAMTSDQFRAFNEYLLGNPDLKWGQLFSEIGEALGKAITNPFQFVSSCVWIPMTITGTAVDSIDYGWFGSIPRSAYRLGGSLLYSLSENIVVPPHPDYATLGSWCHSAPLSEYILSVPPFGTYPLDPNIASQSETVTVDIDIDAITGVGRLQVRGMDGYTFVDTSTLVGVPIQIAQGSLSIERAAQSVAQVVGGAAMLAAGQFGEGAKAIAGGAIDAVSCAYKPAISSMGETGSNAVLGPAKMTGVFYHLTSRSNVLFGRPVYKSYILGNIPGYILVDQPHFSAPATDTEISMVESAMSGGFFLE